MLKQHRRLPRGGGGGGRLFILKRTLDVKKNGWDECNNCWFAFRASLGWGGGHGTGMLKSEPAIGKYKAQRAEALTLTTLLISIIAHQERTFVGPLLSSSISKLPQ